MPEIFNQSKKEREDGYVDRLERFIGQAVYFSLEDLKELKESGVSTENFLDYLCKSRGLLLHGSIEKIPAEAALEAQSEKVFATNKAAIAIMRSIYSNINVNLEYPYFISDSDPLVLEIHIGPSGNHIEVDRGFVYLVDSSGFKNEPEGSWQFIKDGPVNFRAIVETEKRDFQYPVRVFQDS